MSEPAASVRVVLVDDDALVRAGLRMILGGSPTLTIVGEARDGIEAVERGRRGCVPTWSSWTSVCRVVTVSRPPASCSRHRAAARRPAPGRGQVAGAGASGTGDGAAVPRSLASSCSPPSTPTPWCSRPCGSGPAASCSRTPRPHSSSPRCTRVAAGQPILSPSVTAQLIASWRRSDDSRALAAKARLGLLTEREHEVAIADRARVVERARSPASSTWACRPSRPTSHGCWPSSTRTTGSRSP